MENKNNNRVPTEQATHLISGMSNMETNKTAEETFIDCIISNARSFSNESLTRLEVSEMLRHDTSFKLMYKLCVEFSIQQSKEKDARIKELEFANEEVRKKHDLARNVITDQDEEIKRLREVETKWISAEQKPESEKAVLAVIKGCKIPVRVMWVEEFSLSTEDWSFDGDEDYDEATDKYYWPDGWYEWNEMEEVHWMQKDVLFWAEMPQIPIDLNQ